MDKWSYATYRNWFNFQQPPTLDAVENVCFTLVAIGRATTGLSIC